MYLTLFKQMVAAYAELTQETEKGQEEETALQERCKNCRDLSYCDRDYRLCWYH